MLVYTELSKRETRRMQLLGIPTYIFVFVCSSSLGALWALLFIFVALVPYSFFYSKAYAVAAAAGPKPPRLPGHAWRAGGPCDLSKLHGVTSESPAARTAGLILQTQVAAGIAFLQVIFFALVAFYFLRRRSRVHKLLMHEPAGSTAA